MSTEALSDIAKIIMGQSPPSSTYNTKGKGLPFFQGKADFGEMYPSPRVYCSEPNRIAEPGDILMTVRAPVGPTNINVVQSCIGRGLAAIRASKSIDRDYLLYFLRFYEPELAKAGTGSTFAAISRDDLEIVKIPLPPLPEQHRIADLLLRADRLRRLRRVCDGLSESLLQSVFLEMFGDPTRNPKGWKYSTIEDISTKVTDGEHVTPQRTSSGIMLLSARNIQNGFIDFLAGLDYISKNEYERIKIRLDPEYGDVLMSCSGTIGRVTTVNIKEPFSMVRSVALIKPKHSLINAKFLEHFLRSDYGQRIIFQNANISGQPNIFQRQIRELPILLPSLPEQERFARVVRRVESLRRRQAESARQAEGLFQALLAQSFETA